MVIGLQIGKVQGGGAESAHPRPYQILKSPGCLGLNCLPRRGPLIFSLYQLQTPQAIKLKLSDFKKANFTSHTSSLHCDLLPWQQNYKSTSQNLAPWKSEFFV